MLEERGYEFVDPLRRSMKLMSKREFPGKKALGLSSKALYEEYLLPEPTDVKNINAYKNFVKVGYKGDYEFVIDIDYVSILKENVNYYLKSHISHVFTTIQFLMRIQDSLNFEQLNKVNFLLNHILGMSLKDDIDFTSGLMLSDLPTFFRFFITFINTSGRTNKKKYIQIFQSLLNCGMYTGIYNRVSNAQPLSVAINFQDYEILNLLLSYIANKQDALLDENDSRESPMKTAHKIHNSEERDMMIEYLEKTYFS